MALFAKLRRARGGVSGFGPTTEAADASRRFWLGGALVLIAAGLVLAFLGMRTDETGAQPVAVPLPPTAAIPSRATLLLPAPDPDLVEDSPAGPLPVISKADGRQPWQVYARPFDRSDKRPRIALVVSGVGLDRSLSQAALDRLPGAVTLAFNPYATDIKNAMADARSLGHETLIGLPLEPLDYPREDPGPLTLLTSLDQGANTARLDKLMGETVGYVGMVAILGARFEAESTSLNPLLQDLKQRGLMLIDDKPTDQSVVAPLAAQMRLPWAAADRVIDAEADPAAIDQAFADLETAAQHGGAAVGIAALSPALLDRASLWLTTLDGKGFALAPATALAFRQKLPQQQPQPAAATVPTP